MLHLSAVVVEKAGRVLFGPVSFDFGPFAQGLVGASGVGKTSLARVLAGLDSPRSGSVCADSPVVYLPQEEPRPVETVDEYLAEAWCSSAPSDPLWRLLLPEVPGAAPLANLSGGEWMRLRLMQLLTKRNGFVILDEPTNHLDGAGRAAVARFVESYEGGLIVISHDRELLGHVREIVELTPLGLQRYSGAFDAYWEERTARRNRQENALQTAEREKKKVKAEAHEKRLAEEKRMRSGSRKASRGGIPTIVAGGLKRQAEATHGRIVKAGSKIVESADAEVRAALAERETDPFLRLDFEGAAVPAGAILAEARALQIRFPDSTDALWKTPLDFVMSGRRRWRLSGANGSGKSTLLRLIGGGMSGRVEGFFRRAERPFVYLDQGQGMLPEKGTLLDTLEPISRYRIVELRNELAFYGFTA
jgi:ATPase subunit of ABC transporter with duplicated ATPase domains